MAKLNNLRYLGQKKPCWARLIGMSKEFIGPFCCQNGKAKRMLALETRGTKACQQKLQSPALKSTFFSRNKFVRWKSHAKSKIWTVLICSLRLEPSLLVHDSSPLHPPAGLQKQCPPTDKKTCHPASDCGPSVFIFWGSFLLTCAYIAYLVDLGNSKLKLVAPKALLWLKSTSLPVGKIAKSGKG
jgi:hypothetical protein